MMMMMMSSIHPVTDERLYTIHLGNTEARLGLSSLGIVVGASRSNGLALEVVEEARVGTVEGARAAIAVELAGAAEGGLADVGGGGVDDAVETASIARLDGVLDILENVALGEDLGAGLDLEGVVPDIVEVVVDGVEEGVAGDLGGTAGHVVDVVVLEGDQLDLCKY